jgi:hypothetical protein
MSAGILEPSDADDTTESISDEDSETITVPRASRGREIGDRSRCGDAVKAAVLRLKRAVGAALGLFGLLGGSRTWSPGSGNCSML